MTRSDSIFALAALRKLARYVPSGAPRFDGDDAHEWVEVLTRYTSDDVLAAFSVLKHDSVFPSLERMHVELARAAADRNALDHEALNILAHIFCDAPLSDWAQKVWDRYGGDNGWKGVPKTDGSFRFIRGVVEAQAKVVGMPPNWPVTGREAVGMDDDTERIAG